MIPAEVHFPCSSKNRMFDRDAYEAGRCPTQIHDMIGIPARPSERVLISVK